MKNRRQPDRQIRFVKTAGGKYHNLTLKSDGTVLAWGNNDYGQSAVPGGLTNVVAIAASSYHSLALTTQTVGQSD